VIDAPPEPAPTSIPQQPPQYAPLALRCHVFAERFRGFSAAYWAAPHWGHPGLVLPTLHWPVLPLGRECCAAASELSALCPSRLLQPRPACALMR
jgi:hypothetical protein